MSDGTAYDFDFTSIEGLPLPLSGFGGKVMLVVNTASKCGFTPQYKGLESLYETYSGRGLVVIGVPANDFLWQEPGGESEIKAFCELRFGVTFPLTAKAHLKGGKIHPFYRWTKAAMGEAGTPKWNFHKILIGRDGRPVAGFGPRVTPDDPKLIGAIEAALNAPGAG